MWLARTALLAALAVAASPSIARADDAAREARDPSALTVCIQPLGRYDKGLVPGAAAGIRYLYGFEVRVLERAALPRAAYYQPRKRYRAEKLLDFLDETIVPGSGCDFVVGFTKVDISTTKDDKPDWGILGLATIGGPSAVVSSYRMRRKVRRRVVEQRAVKVVNHELGHALGVAHFDQPGCLMNDGQGTVKTVDAESGLLCKRSRERIERRHRIALPERAEMDWAAVLGE